MSSDVQMILETLVLNNGISLATVALVVYDYLLTLSKEVEYIWCKPWTWVSTMFVVARFSGLCWIIISALYGTSFIPGPIEVNVRIFILMETPNLWWLNRCTANYLASVWGYILFLSVSDLVMILRVYAMWNRSRTVLYVLLFIYVPECVVSAVLDGIYNNPNTYVTTGIIQVLDFSFCYESSSFPSETLTHRPVYIARLVLSALLLILAVFQTTKQSFEMYKVTKQWQLNRYMQRLLRDGIVYFIVNVFYQIFSMAIQSSSLTDNATPALQMLVGISFYILLPRFIIGIRELYDRDIRGRFHIDTGFGAVSQSNAGGDATVSAMVFADENPIPEADGGVHDHTDLETGHGMQGSGLDEEAPVRHVD